MTVTAFPMALLRMGVTLEDLPFFPDQDARMQERTKRDVQLFQPAMIAPLLIEITKK